jgi:hypothetical protein
MPTDGLTYGQSDAAKIKKHSNKTQFGNVAIFKNKINLQRVRSVVYTVLYQLR